LQKEDEAKAYAVFTIQQGRVGSRLHGFEGRPTKQFKLQTRTTLESACLPAKGEKKASADAEAFSRRIPDLCDHGIMKGSAVVSVAKP